MQLLRVYDMERVGHWTPLPPGLPPPPGAIIGAQARGPVCQTQPTTDEERRAIRDLANGEPREAKRQNIVRQAKGGGVYRVYSLGVREAHLTDAERRRNARERHHAAAEAAAEIIRRRKTPAAVREALAVWLASLSAEALAAAARLAEPSAKRAARKWARRQARKKRKEEKAKQSQTELVTID